MCDDEIAVFCFSSWCECIRSCWFFSNRRFHVVKEGTPLVFQHYLGMALKAMFCCQIEVICMY